MTDAVLKVRSNHSACCAPWLVTMVYQMRDTGQMLNTGPSQTRLSADFLSSAWRGSRTSGQSTTLWDAGCFYLTSSLFTSLDLLCAIEHKNGGNMILVEVIASTWKHRLWFSPNFLHLKPLSSLSLSFFFCKMVVINTYSVDVM